MKSVIFVFLSANCEFQIWELHEQKLQSSVNTVEQPAEVDTEQKCKKACLGPAGAVLLSSGLPCQSAAFDTNTKKCLLSDSLPWLENGQTWLTKFVVYRCYPTPTQGLAHHTAIFINLIPINFNYLPLLFS